MADNDHTDPNLSNLSASIVSSEQMAQNFLAPMPPSHFLRAWERQPRPAQSRSFRARTVWKKRWDLDRPTTSSSSSSSAPKVAATTTSILAAEPGSGSPAAFRRVVKRRCVVLGDVNAAEDADCNQLLKSITGCTNKTRASKGTSWERRESGRYRKRSIVSKNSQNQSLHTKLQSSPSLRSPLKVANSLAHQGLCFSSPVRQSDKQLLSPLERRRSSSFDLLFCDDKENISSASVSIPEKEDTNKNDAKASESAQEAEFWAPATGELKNERNDQGSVVNYETSPNENETVMSRNDYFDDRTKIGRTGDYTSGVVPLDQANLEAAVSTAEMNNIKQADVQNLVTDTCIDESISASSSTKTGLDMHLVLDTALLKDFLDRVAVSKERKREDIAKQTHISHRRDSDAVRNALGSGSPTKALGKQDPGSPPQYNHSRSKSPDKKKNLPERLLRPDDAEFVKTQDPSFAEMGVSPSPRKSSRRSNRVRNNRMAQSNLENTAVSEDDGSRNDNLTSHTTKNKDKAAVKKTDAQELAQITRKNSNKNKRGALPVWLRLVDLAKDEANILEEQLTEENAAGSGKSASSKTVTWAENLVQYSTGNDQVCIVLKKSSYVTPRKPQNSTSLDFKAPSSLVSASKLHSSRASETESNTTTLEDDIHHLSRAATPAKKNSRAATPQVRRVRGPSTTNGTPIKGLLVPSRASPRAKGTNELSANAMDKKKTAKDLRQNTPKVGRQNEIKGRPASVKALDARPVSKLVQPKVSGLSGLGIGKVSIPAFKSGRQR